MLSTLDYTDSVVNGYKIIHSLKIEAPQFCFVCQSDVVCSVYYALLFSAITHYYNIRLPLFKGEHICHNFLSTLF